MVIYVQEKIFDILIKSFVICLFHPFFQPCFHYSNAFIMSLGVENHHNYMQAVDWIISHHCEKINISQIISTLDLKRSNMAGYMSNKLSRNYNFPIAKFQRNSKVLLKSHVINFNNMLDGNLSTN